MIDDNGAIERAHVLAQFANASPAEIADALAFYRADKAAKEAAARAWQKKRERDEREYRERREHAALRDTRHQQARERIRQALQQAGIEIEQREEQHAQCTVYSIIDNGEVLVTMDEFFDMEGVF